jgi:hypothetical protein
MGISGQHHTPTALYPRGNDPRYPLDRRWGGVGLRAGLDTEARGRILCLCWGSNTGRPIVLSVLRHYINLATPAPVSLIGCRIMIA